MSQYFGRIDYHTAHRFFQQRPSSRFWLTKTTYLKLDIERWREEGITCWRFIFRLMSTKSEKPIVQTCSPHNWRDRPDQCLRLALGLIADDHIPVAERKRAA